MRLGCHFLLQGIFPTQGSNLRFLRWEAGSLPLSHQGSPEFLQEGKKIRLTCSLSSLGPQGELQQRVSAAPPGGDGGNDPQRQESPCRCNVVLGQRAGFLPETSWLLLQVSAPALPGLGPRSDRSLLAQLSLAWEPPEWRWALRCVWAAPSPGASILGQFRGQGTHPPRS